MDGYGLTAFGAKIGIGLMSEMEQDKDTAS